VEGRAVTSFDGREGKVVIKRGLKLERIGQGMKAQGINTHRGCIWKRQVEKKGGGKMNRDNGSQGRERGDIRRVGA